MIEIPPELLVQVLGYLSCLEMVKTRQVSKNWLETIDSTSSLFCSLVLHTSDRWRSQEDFKGLEFFIEKSCCSLKHIHIPRATMSYFPSLPNYHSKLCLCRCTLKTLEMGRLDFSQYTSLVEFGFTCPCLETLQLCYLTPLQRHKRAILISQNQEEESAEESAEESEEEMEAMPNQRATLQRLHLSNFFSNLLSQKPKVHFLSGVTSLSLESIKEEDLRRLLHLVEPTLRHLKMVGFSDAHDIQSINSIVTLRGVQILEISPCRAFPTWIRFPGCRSLILEDVDVESTDLDGLPSSTQDLSLVLGNRSYSSRYGYLDCYQLISDRFPNLCSLNFGHDVGVVSSQLLALLTERNEQRVAKPISRIAIDVIQLDQGAEEKIRSFSVEVIDTGRSKTTQASH